MTYPTTPNGPSGRFSANQVVERGAFNLVCLIYGEELHQVEILIVQILLLGVILEEKCLLQQVMIVY